MKPNIGFMGLGIMGSAMAANVARAGYPLTVYNRTPGKSAALETMGARLADDPKDLAAAADIVVAMVTGPEALNELLWGRDGAAQVFAEGKVFINMSSVSPKYTKELHRQLAPTGVTFLDAPVSGTKRPAQEGTLIILAGGTRESVESVTPFLQAMGKKVVYCGEVGQGSMMKMAINLLLSIMMEGFAEVLNFARMGGLTMETMLDVIHSGPLNCGLYQVKAPVVQEKDFPPNFPLKHMAKDLRFVADTAFDTGAPIPAGLMMLHLYRLGVGKQWGDLDFAAIWKVLEQMSDPS
jgi:3-hydroxyisobutyrate dehydrogenase-like beta-hydroxyacid dehydrogenase